MSRQTGHASGNYRGAGPGNARGNPDNSAMQLPDLIGFLAAAFTTASFVPQAIHTFRTKDVNGISLGMYSAFTLGVCLWLVYGLMLGAWPIVIANTVTLTLAVSILYMKLRYR
jgi:MtN3 and saliva related transmembrane protein